MKNTTRYIRKIDGTVEKIDDARPVDIIPDVDLFINLNKKLGLWTLTEGRTGLSVGYGSTRKRCMEMFSDRIEKIGLDKFKELIEKTVATSGEVPQE